MKKTRFCPKCNLKMRKVTIKGVSNPTNPDGSSFGMFSYFKPFHVGRNVEYSQKVLMCPKCGCHVSAEKPKKPKVKKVKNVRKTTGSKKTVWKVLLVLLIIAVLAVLAVAGAVVLYKNGHMPQRIVDFVKSIMPERLIDFVRARLA